MTTMYHIEITNGVIEIFSHNKAPRVCTAYCAPNAKKYFSVRGLAKPEGIKVRGWPFSKMYMTHGTEENGLAVAWV